MEQARQNTSVYSVGPLVIVKYFGNLATILWQLQVLGLTLFQTHESSQQFPPFLLTCVVRTLYHSSCPCSETLRTGEELLVLLSLQRLSWICGSRKYYPSLLEELTTTQCKHRSTLHRAGITNNTPRVKQWSVFDSPCRIGFLPISFSLMPALEC